MTMPSSNPEPPSDKPHPLPSQQELSLLAATLAHKGNRNTYTEIQWERYLELAMGLHLETEKFLQDLRDTKLTREELLFRYGSSPAVSDYLNSSDFAEKHTTALLRNESDWEKNPALSYVNEEGWKISTPRGLLKAIKSAWGKAGEQLIEKATVMCDSSKKAKIDKYMFDLLTLDELIKWNRRRRSQQSKKSQAARRA